MDHGSAGVAEGASADSQICLLRALRQEQRKRCSTSHLKEELDLVLSERERRFKQVIFRDCQN